MPLLTLLIFDCGRIHMGIKSQPTRLRKAKSPPHVKSYVQPIHKKLSGQLLINSLITKSSK